MRTRALHQSRGSSLLPAANGLRVWFCPLLDHLAVLWANGAPCYPLRRPRQPGYSKSRICFFLLSSRKQQRYSSSLGLIFHFNIKMIILLVLFFFSLLRVNVTYDILRLLSVGNFTRELCVLCGNVTYLHNLEISETHHLSFFCVSEGGSCARPSTLPSTFRNEKDKAVVMGCEGE